MQPTIRDAAPGDSAAILEINAESHPGVSELNPDYLAQLFRVCKLFRTIETERRIAGYLCAMTRNATYDGEEFQWFRDHVLEDFLYVDQVAIGKRSRGRGFGRALYDDLEKYAIQNGIGTLVCEVNYDPPNKESQAFHLQSGFSELGRMETRGLVVSLLAKRGLF